MPVTISSSHVESTERVQPNQANNYENMHGGEVVRLMDELAAVAAMQVAGETCVTAHISSVDFRNPIPVGHVVELAAYVYETGESSLEVQTTAASKDPRDREATATTRACFTMVAVDEGGEPVSVPDVTAVSDRDRALLAEADCA
jgi:acyl-CoA hydrolase